MKSLADHLINERSLGDDIANWFDRTVHKRDYADALTKLRELILRKQREGKLKHAISYYADKIARSYRNVEVRPLLDMYNQVVGESVDDEADKDLTTIVEKVLDDHA